VLDRILEDIIAAVQGARGVILLDGEGESIATAGDREVDLKLLGAWKEIHLDHVREIAGRLGMGTVNAVLFSVDEGNELIVPVAGEYCLLLLLSLYAPLQDILTALRPHMELLKKEVE
jgi:predicted regulator of Ras-like GTPase activity (Roadblock/LC7/MglB family)